MSRSITSRTGGILPSLELTIVMTFTIVLLMGAVGTIFSYDASAVQNNAAGEELEDIVNEEIEPECAGPGAWTDYNTNLKLQDGISRVVYENEHLNATLEGEGYVDHRVERCDDVQICDPGEDVNPATKQCPHDNGYIPGGNPSVHIWSHPDANLIIIDPDT